MNRIDIPLEKIRKIAPGINEEAIYSTINKLNEILEKRKNPLYIFFNPDLEKFAHEIKTEPKNLFQSLNLLCSLFNDRIKHKIILQEDGLFYPLQEEDIQELDSNNRLYNPEDPRIIYEKAQDLVRHAFVINPV